MIPDYQTCIQTMQAEGMWPNIFRHSLQVAKVAGFLAEELTRAGVRLDVKLIEAGALLHDLAKIQTIGNGGDHAALGAELVTRLGFGELARIVLRHVWLNRVSQAAVIDESFVINYSDKRIKHDQVVSLSRRFEDLTIRYGQTPERKEMMHRLFLETQELEKLIFSFLPFGPDQVPLFQTSEAELPALPKG
ncbi:MAG: HDIG domain-containing protein [Deltaproteobacteria bacterium]|nr:HDIG domain-containing protein [Deltaproteobacteria bacterium]